MQLCGGYKNASTGEEMPWLRSDLDLNNTDGRTPKGYLCPRNSLCVERGNPFNGTVSFDNVVQSLQMVFVIMSSNTFSDILYYMTDSDWLASAIFFAFGVVIMTLWLMNLLVAVITSSFQVIREESKGSAFTADDQIYPVIEDDEPVKTSPLQQLFDKTHWVWIVILVFGLVTQCFRSANMGPQRKNFVGTYLQAWIFPKQRTDIFKTPLKQSLQSYCYWKYFCDLLSAGVLFTGVNATGSTLASL